MPAKIAAVQSVPWVLTRARGWRGKTCAVRMPEFAGGQRSSLLFAGWRSAGRGRSAGRWRGEEISAWEMHVHKVNLWFGGPKERYDVNQRGGLCSVG